MEPYKVAGRLAPYARLRRPADAKAAEALSKYIVTDMYAKAVQGHAGGRCREVGRKRTEETLHLSLDGRIRLHRRIEEIPPRMP